MTQGLHESVRAGDLFDRALVLHREGQLAPALDAYRQVVALDHNNAEALHLLGFALFQSRQFDEAANAIRRALQFKPQDGEKPPLIVMIHGGPTSAAGAGFSPAKQFWTSRGFAVVDVNYRGSTGYGRKYREKLNGNWGIADVEDCVAAVEYLTKKGLADPERVAIRGGSAGGFTVLAALTTSDVFKAGASHYGVGDLMLLAGETHKFESRYLDRLLGPLPASEKMYRERSPVNNLDKMAAPAIFFQGLDDKVVPPSQAQTMVDAMRKAGLPVSHYEFADEAHGFRMAETKKRVLDLELGFYAKIFGFTAPGLSEEPAISGLDDGDSGQGKRRVNAPGPKP